MTKATKPPWEKRASESPQSFSRFLAYLAIAPHLRSLRTLAEDLEVSHASLLTLSSRYDWAERATAWDSRTVGHAISAQFKTRLDSQQAYFEKAETTGDKLIQAAEAALDELQKQDDEPLSLSMILRLFDQGFKLKSIGVQVGANKSDVETAITTLLEAGYLPDGLVDELVANIEAMREKNQNLFKRTIEENNDVFEVVRGPE